MAVRGPELVGRRFSSVQQNSVTSASIEAFARAIGASSEIVPPTYLITFSISAAEEFLPTLDFDWSRVVHGDQRFHHHRPVCVGDLLTATSEIENYKSLAGNEFVTIRTDFHESVDNSLVASTWSTLVFRGESA
jgi:hydroxyacyl-ACP dehydratase HTD2-like protein with hotdog domain